MTLGQHLEIIEIYTSEIYFVYIFVSFLSIVYAEFIYTHGIILDSLLVKNKGTLSFANKKLKF